MKKILYLFTALMMLSGCDDKVEIIHCTDMLFFFSANDIENGGNNGYDNYISSIKTADVAAGELLELIVTRNIDIAERKYVVQTATLLVDNSSTASVGTDFEISATSIRFSKGQYSTPVTITTRPSASGKTIVLKLDYDYTDVCPKNQRTSDILTITVK